MARVTQNLREMAARLFQRRAAYRGVFLDADGRMTVYGEQVLKDLAQFCRFSSSTAIVSPVSRSIDPVAMALAEGRREVFLRIIGAMNIDQRKLIAMTMETGERDD